jgi:hypothetical protein
MTTIAQLQTKTRKSKKTTSLQVNQNKVTAEKQFNKIFKQKEFKYFTYDFGVKDLPLLDHMRSDQVNDPSRNRGKADDNIKRLFRCLQAGQWFFESIDILINERGELLNGQHTLDAISQYLLDAKTPRDAVVKVGFKLGVDSRAMPYLDTQKKRSPHQNLRIKQGGVDIKLNRAQEYIVLTEGKNLVHGSPFAKGKIVNFFEYDSVIKKHSSMLNRVFGNRVFCSDFPHIGISYPLFCVAKEDEELANTILDEICDIHNESNREVSKWYPYEKQIPVEHELIEKFRQEKHLKMSGMTSKTGRDCYRAEEFYPLAVNWLVEKYDLDRNIFPK